MALSLDGTTGITSDGGTPVIENLDTTATGIAVTGELTTTGNVGIGTSSPTYKLQVQSGLYSILAGADSGAVSLTDATQKVMRFGVPHYTNAEEPVAGMFISNLSNENGIFIGGGTGVFNAATRISFYTAANTTTTVGTERARIDSSGNLLVGGTSPIDNSRLLITQSGDKACIAISGNSSGGSAHIRNASAQANFTAMYMLTSGNTVAGGIYCSGATTNYATSSDYRLKEDWQPMTGASERVKALKPVNFAWKVDGSRVDGFLAHEAQAVVPEAVIGEKDAMRDEEYEVTPAVVDDEGNVTTPAVMATRSVPVYQGIDQSKLVPLLTAALQEALAKIDDLTARVSALEATNV